MRILITGSSGLIGSALIPRLAAEGHQVIRLVHGRKPDGNDVAVWDPNTGKIETSALKQVDAAINLAGENIAGSRWTEERKKRIRESRVRGTQLLSESLAQLPEPPRVLVSASAVGFYGSRGDEILTEESPPGSGFLTEVCREWEAATEPARQKDIRVVNLRIGMVLSGKGGALAVMLPTFKAGAGGRIGNGLQFMSWIVIDDLTLAIADAIDNESLSGPVNATSPKPVRNVEFTKALGKVLGRPTIVPVPEFGIRLLFGEMADELLLASQRVEPARLQAAGFEFQYPEIEAALNHVLKET